MNLPPSNASAPGDADQTPGGSVSPVGAEPTPPATSSIEYAVSALGDLLNLAFDDARRVDQYARQIVTAFDGIDHGERIALGDRHPGLVEALLLLENQIGRMDRR